MAERSRRFKWLWLAVAYLAIAVAMIGVVVPGLPTTEFVLLAAWAASKSSPRLAAWLENHRLFGPMLRDWKDGGRISRRVKITSTLTMLAAFAFMALTVSHRLSVICTGVLMLIGMGYIWSRPDRRPPADPPDDHPNGPDGHS
ncbi:YbaN family protein [Pseudomonas sp. Marseille-QA0892]